MSTTIMDETTIVEFSGRDAVTDPLTDLLRKGDRELLQAAVEAERDAFLAEFFERRTSGDRAAVVRSGYHPERTVQTGIEPVTVKVPKVRAKDSKPVTFRSALVPPYVRKSKSIKAALPWLYLKGILTACWIRLRAPDRRNSVGGSGENPDGSGKPWRLSYSAPMPARPQKTVGHDWCGMVICRNVR
ncbi:hypothetical protein BV911_16890 [Pseudoruegeria sp. SK021]|nr:hypothetical protein BV911_16890 [Pseudoruegeria sp. SK021]